MTFADKINSFNRKLDFTKLLPEGIQIMNPFRENPDILGITQKFYNKFYNDNNNRYLIIGINPGRHGAGLTGIPFTDTVRLKKYCNLELADTHSYETSSEFMYKMIEAYGGVNKFYSVYYIGAVCPLGFTKISKENRRINYNYYDNKKLLETVYDFIVKSLKDQISFGLKTDKCYCLGTGKNYKFFISLNDKESLFKEIIPLEHPRYIMQYKRKHVKKYIDKYLSLLK
jgi:hypothetical protein